LSYVILEHGPLSAGRTNSTSFCKQSALKNSVMNQADNSEHDITRNFVIYRGSLVLLG